MTDPENTSADTLVRACEIGAAAGLNFIYAGNLPGRVGRWEHTWCPDCGELLIERYGYVIRQQRIGAAGGGVGCGRPVPGGGAVGCWSSVLRAPGRLVGPLSTPPGPPPPNRRPSLP